MTIKDLKQLIKETEIEFMESEGSVAMFRELMALNALYMVFMEKRPSMRAVNEMADRYLIGIWQSHRKTGAFDIEYWNEGN